jgi:hypothetical protein
MPNTPVGDTKKSPSGDLGVKTGKRQRETRWRRCVMKINFKIIYHVQL